MKRLWPALLAVVVLLVLYLVMRGHGEDAATPPVNRAATEPATPAHTAPAAPAPVATTAPPVAPSQETDGDAPRGSGATVGTPALAENPPPEGAKKPKMTLDEKLAETAKHIQVMKHRSELLQTEIDELDKAGKTKEAHEQRIVLERLEKHMKELQTAIDEHKEPM